MPSVNDHAVLTKLLIVLFLVTVLQAYPKVAFRPCKYTVTVFIYLWVHRIQNCGSSEGCSSIES